MIGSLANERPAQPFGVQWKGDHRLLQRLMVRGSVLVVRTRKIMLDGAKVKARREELGLERGELALLLGITPGTLSKVEGGGKRMSLTMALRFAWGLRCGVDALV